MDSTARKAIVGTSVGIVGTASVLNFVGRGGSAQQVAFIAMTTAYNVASLVVVASAAQAIHRRLGS